MLVGAAILPTAPLLVPGASPTLPDGVARVCDAVDATVERLPAHDVTVLLAGDPAGGVHTHREASLAGIGRPDIVAQPRIDRHVADRLAEATGFPLVTEGPLPLDLAVLVLLVGAAPAVVPVAVPEEGAFGQLVAVGAAVVEALGERRGVVVAAGDLSAGLTERSPLHTVDGAGDFDATVVDAVDAGRLDALARIAPAEARRVGARAWAPLAVLHGTLQLTKLGLVRRHYSAPQGVGYLVAQGG